MFQRRFLIGMLLIVVLGLVAACQPMVLPGIQQATLMEQEQKTAEVSTAQLRQLLADGKTFVFDSRPHLEYSTSHIPGALNVAPKPGVEMSVYVSDVAEIERCWCKPKTQQLCFTAMVPSAAQANAWPGNC